MTKPKLVFAPYSQEYFDHPYQIYRRMRGETPNYHELDFDGLQRVHMQNVAGYHNVPVRVMR